MPKLVVGFSQKVGEPNYGARGANVVLELEVDSATASNPELVRALLQGLLRLARQTVIEELARPSANSHEVGSSPTANGHALPTASGIPPRPATPNQIRVIVGLAIRFQVNLSELLQQRFRLNRAEQLSLCEASALIDELKCSQATPLDG